MRSLGTIHLPYIEKVNDRELKIRGYTKNDVDVFVTIRLNNDRVQRLHSLACSIATLKEVFTSTKESVESNVNNAYDRARRW